MSITGPTRRSRRHQAVYFDLTETTDERYDRIIEWLLVALLAFAPLAMGAVQRWSELCVYILCGAMAICLALKLLARPDVPFVWSWSYLPIAVVLGLTAFQLVPLQVSLVRVISPHAYELRTSLAAPLGNLAGSLSHMPLSFYPEATLANLRLLVVVSTVYVVTLNVIRRAEQIRRILAAITTVGMVVAVISLVHLVSDAQRIYGLWGKTRPGWPVAPLINPNHLAQFLNLSMGAALALLLVRFEQAMREHRRSSDGHETLLVNIPATLWMIVAALVLCAVAVVLSLSRGGMLSMLAAGGVSAGLSRRRGTGHLLWMLMPVAWLVMVVVAYVAFDPLIRRIDELRLTESAPAQGRLQILSDVLMAWRSFPLGTGMGTFEVVYPMFDRSATLLLATHAENEYAQMLLEGGIIGVAAVLVFVGMIARRYIECIRSAPSPMASMAAGLGFGLTAVILQSFLDFGQHVPANAMLSAVAAALLVTLSEASRQTSPAAPRERVARRRSRIAGAAAVGAMVAAILLQAWPRARAELSFMPAREIEPKLRAGRWIGSDQEYARLLIAASAAARLSPEDIHYRHWLNVYRWKLISQARDPETGQMLLTEQQLAWADRVARELLIGLRACPTYGPSYSLAAQIEMNILEKPRGAELVRLGWRLNRADPAANFEAGMLDAREGQWEAALTKLKHAAEIDTTGGYLHEGVRALTRDLGRADMAMQLAGNDVAALRTIVQTLESSGQTEAATTVRQRLAEVIKSQAGAKDAPVRVLVEAGRLAAAESDPASAALYFRRALALEYANGDLHLELAKVLASDGQAEQAFEEARIAEQLGSLRARAFILELRQKPTPTTRSTTN